jgi:hypothetical protein
LQGASGSSGGAPQRGGEAAPVLPPAAAGACPGQSLSFDEAYSLIAEDLSGLDPETAGFTRYVSVANRFGAGVCDAQLEADRSALAKALNALSLGTVIVAPLAINTDRLIYRVDLRDLAWDRPIDVGVTDFDDVWEAVIAESPFAVPFSGNDADDAVGITGSSVPLLASDALIDAAMVGELYYRLVGVNPNDTLDDFIQADPAGGVRREPEAARAPRRARQRRPHHPGGLGVAVCREPLRAAAGGGEPTGPGVVRRGEQSVTGSTPSP